MKKNWPMMVLLPISFAIAFLLFIYLAKHASPNRGDAKLRELEQLALETPAHPSFKIIATHVTSRFFDAGLYKYYRSEADYDTVKSFYSTRLIEKGYTMAGEEVRQDWFRNAGKKLTFRKGDFQIVVEFAGTDREQSWNYGVSFLWR